MSETSATFDYVIIVSAEPNHRVLLLEAGKTDSYPWIHIPVGYLYCIGNPRTDWMYHTEPDAGLNNRVQRYPRGRVLGGCSSINGMIYMRGQARDYDAWAKITGDDSWSWQNALADFKAHENHYRLDQGADPITGNNSRFSDMHGSGGEWRVEKQRLSWDVLDSFADAAEQAGIEKIDDFNGGDNAGVGYFDVNQRSVTANREVILSAGAINSPQILQLSGIGPADLLRSHGIEVIRDAPVGENLQDHLQIRAVFKVNGTQTLNTLANSLFGRLKIGAEYLLNRSGPMSMSPSQLGAFTRSDPARPSRGQVQISSANFQDPPKIMPNYLSTAEDRQVAADSLRQARKIMAQPAMQVYAPEELKPGVQHQSDEELARLAGDIANTIFHPVGTVKMGQMDDPSAVLDPHLRVKGVQGLRVVDASVMPTITSGNTNAPTLMIAEKAAAWIKEGL